MDFGTFNLRLHELSDRVYDGELDKHEASRLLLEDAQGLDRDAERDLASRYARDVAMIDPPPAARTRAVRQAQAVVDGFRGQGSSDGDEAEFGRVLGEVDEIVRGAPDEDPTKIYQPLAPLRHWLDRRWVAEADQ